MITEVWAEIVSSKKFWIASRLENPSLDPKCLHKYISLWFIISVSHNKGGKNLSLEVLYNSVLYTVKTHFFFENTEFKEIVIMVLEKQNHMYIHKNMCQNFYLPKYSWSFYRQKKISVFKNKGQRTSWILGKILVTIDLNTKLFCIVFWNVKFKTSCNIKRNWTVKLIHCSVSQVNVSYCLNFLIFIFCYCCRY